MPYRFPKTALGAVIVVALLWVNTAIATAGDKLTEANMTHNDYDQLIETKSSVEDEAPTEKPMPVHNLTDKQEQDIVDLGGSKVIPAKDWKNKTPEERDAQLRSIKERLPAGTTLILTVPKGEVWLIPPRTKEAEPSNERRYYLTVLILSLRRWTAAELAKLPVSVPPDNPISQSDRHGTTPERVVQRTNEEP